MKKLRVFEAFAGYGSQSIALRNIGVDYEVVAISEIDKYAVQAYDALRDDKILNLGDISKINPNDIPDHDLFTYSFPCQDISNAGKQRGLGKGSGTRSGLLWECEKIIEVKKPKYLLMENVKNLVGKKFKSEFDKWCDWLETQGYKNFYKVLNAKDYGIPQNRERVFMISVLDENYKYEFPEKFPLELRLKDILEDVVDDKYYISDEVVGKLISVIDTAKLEYSICGAIRGRYANDGRILQKLEVNSSEYTNTLTTVQKDNVLCDKVMKVLQLNGSQDGVVVDTRGISPTHTAGHGNCPKVLVKEATKKVHSIANVGDSINLGHPNIKTRRGSVGHGVAQTLTTSCNQVIIEYIYRIRKLTQKECFRLMGLNDYDIDRLLHSGISNSQLYKLAGNSIVVDVLEYIFKELFKEYVK